MDQTQSQHAAGPPDRPIDPAAAQLLAEASRNRMLGATVFIRYLASWTDSPSA